MRGEAPEGNLDLVTLCHNEHYVTELRHIAPTSGLIYLDGDTSMSPGTWEAVMRGVGGAVADHRRRHGRHAQQRVRRGATARPSRRDRQADVGFCFFDNAAIAARHAQAQHTARSNAPRWSIFDVHHGNGTQDIFWADPTVRCIARRIQMPLFPGTGASGERGEHDTIVNAPLRPGRRRSGNSRSAFENVILPQLKKFSPGTDHHLRRLRRALPGDPLASLNFAGGGLWLGDAATDGSRGPKLLAAGSSRCWKAALCMICRG